MKHSDKNTLLIIGGLLILLIMATKAFEPVLKNFLPSVEGFTPVPLWDYKQWSWGYGTAAGYDPNKKPAGTITRDQAWVEALKVIGSHYSYLKPLIKVDLKPQQWAALLSFAYNLGPGMADNLVPNINAQNQAALATQWMKYVIAGGIYNAGLKARRQKELALWNS